MTVIDRERQQCCRIIVQLVNHYINSSHDTEFFGAIAQWYFDLHLFFFIFLTNLLAK